MAFKMRPGRTHVAAVEQSFHGRTAAVRVHHVGRAAEVVLPAARAVRRELDQAPRRRGHRQHVTENTAAVIVEPVQGVGGAFDMGQEFLAALRSAATRPARC
jgi:acetylornithine/succinyldiaminopimelate/putrescine aminotransferase